MYVILRSKCKILWCNVLYRLSRILNIINQYIFNDFKSPLIHILSKKAIFRTKRSLSFLHNSKRNNTTLGSLKMSSVHSTSVFQGKEDRFQGITVFSEKENCGIEEFPEKLKNSLTAWTEGKKRGVWFKVHLDQSVWIPILVKNGFKYHHAKEDYVMLYHWLPVDESHNIPPYAHTMIGVGAVVVNDRDQVLVVKEKYFYKVPMWKLPGGYVEPGENIVDAAIREVSEETGIKTQFESVLTLRHGHGAMFGCSDIYVVVSLKALNVEIQKCKREIDACQWMDVEEYLSHPHIHELNRFFVEKMLHHKKHNLKIDCHHGIHELLRKPYTVYSVVKNDSQDDSSDNVPYLLGGEKSK